MKKRVVLVKPPERSSFSFGTFSLGVLAAAIRHRAEVSIVDATDLPLHVAVDKVWSRQPDLVGVTVMALSSVQPAGAFIRQLRSSRDGSRRAASCSIVAGGHGASMMPAALLEAGVDAIVVGEGELTLQGIVDGGLAPGAPGLACLLDGRLVMGPPQPLVRPLDELAPPARDLMPPPPNGMHLMETSRGCPHACSFCEATRFHRRQWRPYSPERVAREARRLVDELDAWVIQFADDNFAASAPRVLQVCEALAEQALPLFFAASARADDLLAHPDVLPAMAAARILRVTVGIETLSWETAVRVDKPIPLEAYKEAFERMRTLGIFSVASLIVGLPGEEGEMREKAVELAVEAGPDSAHFLPLLPLPGAPLSSVRAGLDPDPADVRDARRFSQQFFRHPAVQARLRNAAETDTLRGLLARATLQRRLASH